MFEFVKVADDASSVGMSGAIWGNVKADLMQSDNSQGIFKLVDLAVANDVVLGTSHTADFGQGLEIFTSAGGSTWAQTAHLVYPAGELSLPAAAASEGYITGGHNVGTLTPISKSNGQVAFEVAFSIRTTVAANTIGAFVGFSDPALAATGALVASTLIPKVAGNFVGFSILPADPTIIHAIHQKASQTTVTVASTATATLALDTLIKLGFLYNPLTDSLRFFVNGVDIGGEIVSSATQFPTAALIPSLFFKVGTGAAANAIDIAWMAYSVSR